MTGPHHFSTDAGSVQDLQAITAAEVSEMPVHYDFKVASPNSSDEPNIPLQLACYLLRSPHPPSTTGPPFAKRATSKLTSSKKSCLVTVHSKPVSSPAPQDLVVLWCEPQFRTEMFSQPSAGPSPKTQSRGKWRQNVCIAGGVRGSHSLTQ